MILDSSAIVALLIDEPSAVTFGERIALVDACRVGAPTLVETGMVLTRYLGDPGRSILGDFLHQRGVEVVPFREIHWRVAQSAFVRFGKGRHPAALNLGDCLTYAVSRLADESLLCIGDDFTKTDLVLVDL